MALKISIIILYWHMFLLTTHPGLEDIAANEIKSYSRINKLADYPLELNPFRIRGRILYHAPAADDIIHLILYKLQSVYQIIHYWYHWEITDQNFTTLFKEKLLKADLNLWDKDKSFRVSCTRRGNHDFKSPEIAALAGSIIQQRFSNPVDLVNYEVDFRVDILANHVFIGIKLDTTRDKKIFKRIYSQRVSLKTQLAYGLLNLSGILKRPGSLLDPFCGSGTILYEAGVLLPQITLWGSDKNPRAAQGCQVNLNHAGLYSRSFIQTADAQELFKYYQKHSIDYIVTNPPFGYQIGGKINFYWLYKHFLEQAGQVLVSKGRLVLMTVSHRSLLNRVIREIGLYNIVHVRIIESGGMYPGIFVLQKVH